MEQSSQHYHLQIVEVATTNASLAVIVVARFAAEGSPMGGGGRIKSDSQHCVAADTRCCSTPASCVVVPPQGERGKLLLGLQQGDVFCYLEVDYFLF